jgi:hypothetical protein
MAFRLLDMAQQRWRRLDGAHVSDSPERCRYRGFESIPLRQRVRAASAIARISSTAWRKRLEAFIGMLEGRNFGNLVVRV